MKKTIQFTSTLESWWAYTVDENGPSVGRAFLYIFLICHACISVWALVAVCFFLATSSEIGRPYQILFLLSLLSPFQFFYTRGLLLRSKRSFERVFVPTECRVVFTEDGFGPVPLPGEFAPWSTVRTKQTSVYWALHCIGDGGDTVLVIPIDVIDDELRALIMDHTANAKGSRSDA